VARIAVLPLWGRIVIITAAKYLPKIQPAKGCDADGNGDMGDVSTVIGEAGLVAGLVETTRTSGSQDRNAAAQAGDGGVQGQWQGQGQIWMELEHLPSYSAIDRQIMPSEELREAGIEPLNAAREAPQISCDLAAGINPVVSTLSGKIK
jgi:hypothetical protein